ncbi:EAL domain-containing protein [Bacillus sp. 31A1R]|uniref:EAL domain-containing protein n=1 Tax=Robertmurraya mangrovi TaxID=3098077 RepID=A0ABU5IVR1_9BACI|nr:EAL domain-containing protein [Bacillus sp. 31A1R]MDZ5471224.1 EAL domain-containing protein [Bacillus sp. 31A1R]
MDNVIEMFHVDASIDSLMDQIGELQGSQKDELISVLKSFANLKQAIDTSIIIAATNTRGDILYANDKFCEISNYERSELIGKNHRILNSGYHDKSFFKQMWSEISKGNVWEGEIKNKKKDGTFYWVKTTIVPVKGEDGKPSSYISLRTDITEGKQAQEELVTALQNDFTQVVNSMNSLIYKVIINQEGQFVYKQVAGKLANQLGLNNETLENKLPKDIFSTDISTLLDQKFKSAFLGQPESYSYRFNNRQLLTHLSPVYRDGEVHEIIGCTNDITELHQAQEEIKFLAYHDILTNLPNRRKFNEDIHELIVKSNENGQKFALLYLDLNQFKKINDAFGHNVGDSLLRAVSVRLQESIGTEGEIYKFSGDDFIIVFRNVLNPSFISDKAKNIVSIFSHAFSLSNSMDVVTSSSIGICMYPNHGENSDQLLKNADLAMNIAKQKGRNIFKWYETGMSKNEDEKLQIEHYLRKAIENNEFELYFQPKLNLFSNRINGVEALLRWNNPVLGMVPPDKFIPIAEETGFIIQIDEWVLEKACQQSKEWFLLDPDNPVSIAVNISPLHFRIPNFYYIVEKVLKETGLNPSLLEIEITENSIIENTEECIVCLEKLRTLGVSVSIDDFGTGYSSLNYLRKFPISSLKIDRSFIQEVSQNRENVAIVKAIMSLAQELKLKVVAEGIETYEALEILRSLGCDEIQGYLISKPLPVQEFQNMFSQRSPIL